MEKTYPLYYSGRDKLLCLIVNEGTQFFAMIFIKPLFTLLFVRQVKLVMQVNLCLLLSFTVMLRVSGFLRPLVYARSQNQRLMSTIGRNSASDVEPDRGEGYRTIYSRTSHIEAQGR